VKGALRWFFGDRVREGNASATFWYDMTHGQINDSCRELYLYSDSDHLTPCKFLEEVRMRSEAKRQLEYLERSDNNTPTIPSTTITN